MTSLGSFFYLQKKFDESATYDERAIAILENTHGPVHPDLAACLDNLGSARSDQGRYEEAIALHRRALGIYEKLYGPNHSELVTPLLGLGRTYVDAGDHAAARPVLERAFALCGDGTDPLYRADLEFLLAEALDKRDRRRARTLAIAARDVYRATAHQEEGLAVANEWLQGHPLLP